MAATRPGQAALEAKVALVCFFRKLQAPSFGSRPGERSQKMFDLNFREFLDITIDGPINLRAVGLGTWNVHGWVGPLESIPRMGAGGSAWMAPTAGRTGPDGSVRADTVALSALRQAESTCAVM